MKFSLLILLATALFVAAVYFFYGAGDLLTAKDYVAVINEVTVRQWQSKDKYNDDGTLKSGIAYDIAMSLQIPQDLREALGYEKDSLAIKDSIMVDLNAQGGVEVCLSNSFGFGGQNDTAVVRRFRA